MVEYCLSGPKIKIYIIRHLVMCHFLVGSLWHCHADFHSDATLPDLHVVAIIRKAILTVLLLILILLHTILLIVLIIVLIIVLGIVRNIKHWLGLHPFFVSFLSPLPDFSCLLVLHVDLLLDTLQCLFLPLLPVCLFIKLILRQLRRLLQHCLRSLVDDLLGFGCLLRLRRSLPPVLLGLDLLLALCPLLLPLQLLLDLLVVLLNNLELRQLLIDQG